MHPLSFKTITDVYDALLCEWLDLYETAFPPEERVLVSTFVRRLREKQGGISHPGQMLAAQDDRQELVGLAFFTLQPTENCFTLWYLAVDAARRDQGYGSQIYREVVRLSKIALTTGILFEVEIPETTVPLEKQLLAQRRIQFYRRNGAKLLTGIHYLQSVGTHQPLTPMHLMFHPLGDVDSQNVFNMAKSIYGEYLTQTGTLALS